MSKLLILVAAAVAIAVGLSKLRGSGAITAAAGVTPQPPGLDYQTVVGGDFGEGLAGIEFQLTAPRQTIVPGGDFGEGQSGAEEFNLTPAQTSAAQREAFDSLII